MREFRVLTPLLPIPNSLHPEIERGSAVIQASTPISFSKSGAATGRRAIRASASIKP